ncbi:hypothetical protein ABBQ32_011422 [Trebouxia sp. C0010 RCD-2024]
MSLCIQMRLDTNLLWRHEVSCATCTEVKYRHIARQLNAKFHYKDRRNFPYKRTGQGCSQNIRNLDRTYKQEYTRGRRHMLKAQMQETGCATEEGKKERK